MRSARGNGNRDSARLTPALLVAVSVTFAVRFPISFPLALYVVAVRRFTFGAYPGSGPRVGSPASWVLRRVSYVVRLVCVHNPCFIPSSDLQHFVFRHPLK